MLDIFQNWEPAVPVLKDVQHGAVVKSTLFGPDLPWVMALTWLFLGCTRFGDKRGMLKVERMRKFERISMPFRRLTSGSPRETGFFPPVAAPRLDHDNSD